jgi:hypothetical protein
MSSTIEAVRHFAACTPSRIAVRSTTERLTYGDLEMRARHIARELEARDIGVAALVADNSPAWLIVDLAAQLAGAVLVPLPPFFTNGRLHTRSGTAPQTPCSRIHAPALRDRHRHARSWPLSAAARMVLAAREPASPIAAGTQRSATSGTTESRRRVSAPQACKIVDSLRRGRRRGIASSLRAPLATLLGTSPASMPLMNGAESIDSRTGLVGVPFRSCLPLGCVESYGAQA